MMGRPSGNAGPKIRIETLEDAALEYLEQEKSVIPIAKGTKKPPKGFEWKQFQTRYATPDEVAGWFKKNPDAQIAMVTGAISRVAVVDGDSARGNPNPKLTSSKTGAGAISKMLRRGFK